MFGLIGIDRIIIYRKYLKQDMQEDKDKKLVVYSYFRSSTAWRVRIALNLKHIPHEFKFIHLVKGQQKNEDYKKINPNGAVPSIVLPNGKILIQSVAIIEYLDEVYHEHPLLPKDPIIKAQIRGFCEVINSGIHPYQNLRCLEKVANDYKGDKMQWARYWVVKGMETIQAMLKNSRGKYCFGDQLTAADLFFVPQVQGGSVRFNVSLDDYPNIKQVLGNLQKIQAFEKAQPQNQPDFEK